MPLYFFHVISHGQALEDAEGTEFPDDGTAMREGLASLGDVISEAAKRNQLVFQAGIEIVREDGSVLGHLTGDLAVKAEPNLGASSRYFTKQHREGRVKADS